MSAHSNIGPSSAKRWIACPGSVALSAQCPKPPTNEYAAQGTVAHELAEAFVTGKIDELDLQARVGETVKCDGHEIEIDDEMVDGVLLYAQVIKEDHEKLKQSNKPAPITREAEIRVKVNSVSDQLWGTADYLQFRRGDRLLVYDFKYGRNTVEAVENEQMALYALGAMETLAGSAFDTVELVIVQPRAGHAEGQVRRWVAPVAWLNQFRIQAHTAVIKSKEPNAPLVPGDHCRWCPARAYGCPAIAKAVEDQTKADFSVVAPTEAEVKQGKLKTLPDVKLMPIEKLAMALDWQEAVESWFGSIKDRVQEMLSAGEKVPGYKLVDGRSNRKWTDENVVAAKFGALFGDKIYEPQKILSPAKMEKLVGKNRMDSLTFKPEAKKAIAKDVDPRPVASTGAQDAFEALPAPVNTQSLEDELLGLTPVKKLWP